MEIKLTNTNFIDEVLNKKTLVLVDFFAEWCGPCMMIAPILEQIAEELDGKIIIGKVNVDEEPNLADYFEVSSIPTLCFFKDGKLIQKQVGYMNKEDLIKLINSII